MSAADASPSHARGTIDCLPSDILICVFEALCDCDRDRDCKLSQLVLPLMTVRKSWNLVAHPLLVRRLEFTTLLQLERAATALELHESQGKPLGHCVRDISVDIDPEIGWDNPCGLPFRSEQLLIRILLQVTHLRYLSIVNVFDPEILDILGRRSIHSLTRLHIEIGGLSQSDPTPIPIVGHVNRFSNLKTLKINCYGDLPVDQPLGFDLVGLKSLVWFGYDPSCSSQAAFFTKCRFDNLEELYLHQWGNQNSRCDGHDELCQFLGYLSRLKLFVPDIVNAGAVLPYISPSVHTVDLTSSQFFNSTYIFYIPLSVRKIHLSVCTIGPDPGLEALKILENTDTGIRTVSVWYWPPLAWESVPFTWVEGLAELARLGQDSADPDLSELAVFTCIMLGHSLRLAQKGIKLVDGYGVLGRCIYPDTLAHES